MSCGKNRKTVTAAEAATGTMAYRILKAHNTSGNNGTAAD